MSLLSPYNQIALLIFDLHSKTFKEDESLQLIDLIDAKLDMYSRSLSKTQLRALTSLNIRLSIQERRRKANLN